MNKGFYHMFANGNETQSFILSKEDFTAAFNRFGVCAANCQISVLAFSIEETHPHSLLYGEYEKAVEFKLMYENSTLHYTSSNRGGLDGLQFSLELLEVDEIEYLRRVGCYIINQATKDGKGVMPYDYLWGTGSLYFRSSNHKSIWITDVRDELAEPIRASSISGKELKRICHSRSVIPEDWIICNDLIMPENYVDIRRFEEIYGTHNCFRAFLSSGRAKYDEIAQAMARRSGIMLNDLEARKIAGEKSKKMFGTANIKSLSPDKRLKLACEIKKELQMSFRQLAMVTRLPEKEIRKYLE